MKKTTTVDIILTALFSSLIAAGAFLKIPIPFVPITMQLFFTTMAGILLGGNLGALSVIIYIAIGLMGVPVFASGGGISYVLQPTFGYIIGFVIGTFVTGKISNKVDNPSFKRMICANFSGLLIVYAVGMIYYWLINTLYLDTVVGAKTLFIYCFAITVPGDIVMSILALFIGKRLIPVMHNKGFRRT